MTLPICTLDRRSKNWPYLLSQMPGKSAPSKLYLKGNLPSSDTLIVAVVGTRKPSSYGKEAARVISRELTRAGVVIVSGMALGIDSIAHEEALGQKTPTIAVLGSGISDGAIYPKANLSLARRILEHDGAIISEYEPDKKAEVWTFPARNRIIAGIAHSTIVIEAGEKSGALITARLALDYGRNVFAVPGSIFNEQSRGTNSLIMDGATPITDANNLLETLGLSPNIKISRESSACAEENKILEILSEERSLDEIIKLSGMSASAALSITTGLEIRGMIKGLGGGMYRKA